MKLYPLKFEVTPLVQWRSFVRAKGGHAPLITVAKGCPLVLLRLEIKLRQCFGKHPGGQGSGRLPPNRRETDVQITNRRWHMPGMVWLAVHQQQNT